MKRAMVFAGILLAAQLCIADELPDQRSDIIRITSEIEQLYRSGTALHRDHNLMYDDQFMACVEKSRPLRAKAKALRGEVKQLARMSYRIKLVLASDAAFECVYCSDGAASACNRIPSGLKAVRADLASESN